MRYKKLLISLAVLIGSFSIGSIYQNTVHADYPSNYEYDPGFDAAQDAKYGSDAVENSFENEYGLEPASKKRYYEREHTQELINKSGYGIPKSEREKLDSEKPLSQVYPNGATVERNGKIKVNHGPKKYKVMGHWVDYKVYKYYKKCKNNFNNYKMKLFDKERKKSNSWIAHHSRIGHSKIYYVKYKDFSKRNWRYAFPDWGSSTVTNKLGLTKSYKSIIKAINKTTQKHWITYPANITVHPGQLVQMKYIGDDDGYTNIYRVKFNGKLYYYANDYDKYRSDVTPFTADYSKKDNCYYSALKPWQSKIIILNNKDKHIKQGTNWSYNHNLDDSEYKLKGRTWRNSGLGTDAPDWIV